jgi:hypothetical protein
MRRIVLSLAVLSTVALNACSGGGSVLNFDSSAKPGAVIVTVVGSSNIARVLPGGSLPISAVAVRGSQNGFTNANRFSWSAALITSGSYIATADGSTKACQPINLTVPGPVTSAFATDLNTPPYSTIAIDPTNESNILFLPPPVFPVPAGFPVGTTIQINFPYCVVVSATSLDNPAAVGSITVAVVNPQSPVN